MQQIILKKEIDKTKLDALLVFLKSWNIEVELKTSPVISKKQSAFSLAAGIWKDYNIDGNELRTKAWTRNK
ncbi:MAG TPA: hypothetical protein PKD85_08010 [Saprospiraceae bacterium]|nr:hypothetical protein [Saprospiraceae bacterium]